MTNPNVMLCIMLIIYLISQIVGLLFVKSSPNFTNQKYTLSLSRRCHLFKLNVMVL